MNYLSRYGLCDDSSAMAGQTTTSFSEQASSLIQALAARGVQRRYKSGTLLIQEGDEGNTLFIVISGRLRAFSSNEEADKEITYGIYGPGEYLGEMSLDGGKRSAHVITMEPTTCAVISREVLLGFIKEQPEFALELIAKLIRRARLATESARSMALVDVYGRLALLLDQQAAPHVDGTRLIKNRLTHQELANHLACSREMVSRLLKDLEKGGYIAQQGRDLLLMKALPKRW